MLANQVALDIQRALSQIARQQKILAGGKRVTEPSDDPTAAIQMQTARSRKAAIEQYQRNLGAAISHLNAVDSTLLGVQETLTQARIDAVKGSDDAIGAAGRTALAAHVNELLETLVEQATARGPSGEYLFGGQETTTAPYTVTRNAIGEITAVAPNPRGIDGVVTVETGEGLTVTTSASGTNVFGPTAASDYAFNVLIQLRDNLRLNNGPAVQAAIANLDTAAGRVGASSATIGARLGALSLIEDGLAKRLVDHADTLSRLEDADMAQAMLDFQRHESIYQAALAAGARIIQPTLLDFLR
jgi:flagellar hook-associated protein 3 FlgL